jgi:hypothetical protein
MFHTKSISDLKQLDKNLYSYTFLHFDALLLCPIYPKILFTKLNNLRLIRKEELQEFTSC